MDSHTGERLQAASDFKGKDVYAPLEVSWHKGSKMLDSTR